MNTYITFMVKGDSVSLSLSLYVYNLFIFCEKKLPDITLIFGKIWRVKTQQDYAGVATESANPHSTSECLVQT